MDLFDSMCAYKLQLLESPISHLNPQSTFKNQDFYCSLYLSAFISLMSTSTSKSNVGNKALSNGTADRQSHYLFIYILTGC